MGFKQQNPTRRSGFSYFFRDQGKTLFIKKPGGRKYYAFEVPRRIDREKFLQSMFVELVKKERAGAEYYYLKDGVPTNRKRGATEIKIKIQGARRFKKAKIPKEVPTSHFDDFRDKLIVLFRREKRFRERPERERIQAEREAEAEVEADVSAYEDLGIQTGIYAKSEKYDQTEYTSNTILLKKPLKITKENVEDFLEYMRTSGLTIAHELLKDLGIKENQKFRLRVLGGGDYTRTKTDTAGRRLTEKDRFGFSLKRAIYTKDGFENFAEKFSANLDSKFTGRNSYLSRSASGFLTFEGFKVEIYD